MQKYTHTFKYHYTSFIRQKTGPRARELCPLPLRAREHFCSLSLSEGKYNYSRSHCFMVFPRTTILFFFFLSAFDPSPSPWSRGIGPSLPGTRLAFWSLEFG